MVEVSMLCPVCNENEEAEPGTACHECSVLALKRYGWADGTMDAQGRLHRGRADVDAGDELDQRMARARQPARAVDQAHRLATIHPDQTAWGAGWVGGRVCRTEVWVEVGGRRYQGHGPTIATAIGHLLSELEQVPG